MTLLWILLQAHLMPSKAHSLQRGAFTVGEVAVGAIVGGLTATALTMIPFSMVPFGAEFAQAAGLGVGVSMLAYGTKTSSMVFTLGGAITTLAATRNILGILGVFPGLQNRLTMQAEGDNVGYFGHMNLDGYTALDSVEVDRSSMQPTQNYGAETVEQQMTARDSRSGNRTRNGWKQP